MQVFYKNQLFQIIEEVKLDPQLFEVYETEEGKYDTTVVRLIGTDHRFTILENPKSFHHFNYKYSLDKPYAPESKYKKRFLPFRLLPGNKARYSFGKIEKQFIHWLEVELEDYFLNLNEVDLWQQYQDQSFFDLNEQDSGSDRKEYFSDSEKAQIITALNKARKEAEEKLSIKEQDLEILNEKVDYLMDAVQRLNKFDWKSVLISSTVDIISDLTLDPSGGKMLFDIFSSAFSGFPRLLG